VLLVDEGAGNCTEGGALWSLAGQPASAGYEHGRTVDPRLVRTSTAHVGGLNTQDGKRVFPNAKSFVRKAEKRTFGVAGNRRKSAERCATVLSEARKQLAEPYISGKWNRSAAPRAIVDGVRFVRCYGPHPLGQWMHSGCTCAQRDGRGFTPDDLKEILYSRRIYCGVPAQPCVKGGQRLFQAVVAQGL